MLSWVARDAMHLIWRCLPRIGLRVDCTGVLEHGLLLPFQLCSCAKAAAEMRGMLVPAGCVMCLLLLPAQSLLTMALSTPGVSTALKDYQLGLLQCLGLLCSLIGLFLHPSQKAWWAAPAAAGPCHSHGE